MNGLAQFVVVLPIIFGGGEPTPQCDVRIEMVSESLEHEIDVILDEECPVKEVSGFIATDHDNVGSTLSIGGCIDGWSCGWGYDPPLHEDQAGKCMIDWPAPNWFVVKCEHPTPYTGKQNLLYTLQSWEGGEFLLTWQMPFPVQAPPPVYLP